MRGDPDHPANFGRLCSKGSALGETVGARRAAAQPDHSGQRRQAGTRRSISSPARFANTIAEHGPDSVAFYVSGQLLTEDYYVANKLMKGFIGSANIDTNSRLCMASSVAGHKRAFGADIVPGSYEDLELADLVVLVGSNLAWCHPVLYQRLAAREAGATEHAHRRHRSAPHRRPPRSPTCICRCAPDGDVRAVQRPARASGRATAPLDRAYIEPHTTGFAEALAAARANDLADNRRAHRPCGRGPHGLLRPVRRNERIVTVYSQGVNQSSAGTDKVNAIINCHLATGRIGKPGMGPFSVTGQPNAMGGREVGGLANMLAAHMDFDNPEHRDARADASGTRRASPTKPGLKAVDMFDAVADGRIKALWIMATNPVVSLPDADARARGAGACPFVVVSDVHRPHRHDCASPMCCCRRPPGARRTARSPIPSAASRASAPFCPRPARRAPTGGISPRSRAAWASATPSPMPRPAEIFAEHAALIGRSRTAARATSTSAPTRTSAMRTTTR